MTNQHPITPPTELMQQVNQWEEDWHHGKIKHIELEPYIAAQAAQWGADQELEACCEWTTANFGELYGQNLYLFRRPKPPSLKQQALEALSEMEDECLMVTYAATIRRALEALPND